MLAEPDSGPCRRNPIARDCLWRGGFKRGDAGLVAKKGFVCFGSGSLGQVAVREFQSMSES
jgi:hypothetical protein